MLTCITTTNVTKNKGFTLIELVIVIVLLGVLSVGISSFLTMGSQIFVDVKNRSQLTATARFAVERMNREVRSALPNSIRVTYNNERQCVEFIPILTTANYVDIPAQPEDVTANNMIKTVRFDNTLLPLGSSNYNVVVYPLLENDAYSTPAGELPKKFTLENAVIDTNTGINSEWNINFSNNVLFKEDSPTSRLFFVDEPVSFCVKGSELRRFVGSNPNIAAISDSDGVLMAEYIYMPRDSSLQLIQAELPFRVAERTQHRNSTILTKLQFEKNDEIIVFNNEIHISNVP